MRGFGRLNHFLRLPESGQGIRGRFVDVVPVVNIPFGIDAVTVVHQLELGSDMLVRKLACAVFTTGEILFQGHVVHKVQIDFLRKVHGGATHEISAVQRDVKMSRKAE